MFNFFKKISHLTFPFFVFDYYYSSFWLALSVKVLAGLYILTQIASCFRKDTINNDIEIKIPLRKIKILIIDDDNVSRSLINKLILKISSNVEIRFANDGGIGISMIKSFAPDVVFLDMLMQKMNGNEMVQKVVKSCPKYLDRIVVLTSLDSSSKEVQESIISGCDFLSKPISFIKINNMLCKVLDRYKLKNNLSEIT